MRFLDTSVLLYSISRVPEISADLLFRSGRSAERWQISYWDAAIIEAARHLGCRQVLSEDLNAGQDFSGLIVVNPFAGCDI
jgi:predicted nucleic acid-binding protein